MSALQVPEFKSEFAPGVAELLNRKQPSQQRRQWAERLKINEEQHIQSVMRHPTALNKHGVFQRRLAGPPLTAPLMFCRLLMARLSSQAV